MHLLAELLKCVVTGPDDVLGCVYCVVDVRELAAPHFKGSRMELLVARIEVRILLIFHEVSYQKLTPVTSLGSSKTLGRLGALAKLFDREEAPIGGHPRIRDKRVVDKVD